MSVHRGRAEVVGRWPNRRDWAIAYIEVGFADQSHFSRRFRVNEGRSPAKFAREQARGILPPK